MTVLLLSISLASWIFAWIFAMRAMREWRRAANLWRERAERNEK